MGKRKAQEDNNYNMELCDMLYELAEYEKIITLNIYKYNAYMQAAQTLANYSVKITSGKEARKLKGIGKKIAEKIDEYLKSGKIAKLEKIKNNQKFIAIKLLTRVSGIGPRKARQLFEEGVKNLQDLNKVKDKLNHHQRIGLKYFYDFEINIPRKEISQIERIITEEIVGMDKNYIVTICGSYRRGKAVSGDIDVLVTHPNYKTGISKNIRLKYETVLEDIIENLQSISLVIDVIALGNTKFMGVCRIEKEKPARRLDIRMIPYDQYYCGLLYFTGSDLFNRNMRTHALQQGYTLNEYSLRPIGETGVLGSPIPIHSEKDIFEYINYPYKKPTERNL